MNVDAIRKRCEDFRAFIIRQRDGGLPVMSHEEHVDTLAGFAAYCTEDIPDLCDHIAKQQEEMYHLHKALRDGTDAPEWPETLSDCLDVVIAERDKSCEECEKLIAEKHLLQQLWVTVESSCDPPNGCNDPVILKEYMKACMKKSEAIHQFYDEERANGTHTRRTGRQAPSRPQSKGEHQGGSKADKGERGEAETGRGEGCA